LFQKHSNVVMSRNNLHALRGKKMKETVLVALLSDLPVIAIAATSQPENLDACARQKGTGTELSQLPQCSANVRPESVLKSGDFPSSQIVGSSIAVANSASEWTVVNTIPRMSASATSHGQGEAHAYILSSRPLGNLADARTGTYSQNISHTSVHTFHFGYQTQISTGSINVTRSESWATGENTSQGTATAIATGSSKSATSGLITDANLGIAMNGSATGAGTASASVTGPRIIKAQNISRSKSQTISITIVNGGQAPATAQTLNSAAGTSRAQAISSGSVQISAQTGALSVTASSTNLHSSANSIAGSINRTELSPASVLVNGRANATSTYKQTTFSNSTLSITPAATVITSNQIQISLISQSSSPVTHNPGGTNLTTMGMTGSATKMNITNEK
jgi:hypothetical protein